MVVASGRAAYVHCLAPRISLLVVFDTAHTIQAKRARIRRICVSAASRTTSPHTCPGIQSCLFLEIAVVGCEGIVGVSLFMGGESRPSRAVVQSAGTGYRLQSKVIKEEFKRSPVLHLLLRYTQALITQMAQTACNRTIR